MTLTQRHSAMAIIALTQDIVTYARTVKGSITYNAIPDELVEKNPNKFRRVVSNIHSAAAQVCETYDKLVRLARRSLGI